MALKLKRQFAGKAVVLTDEDEQVFGPDTMAACKAFIAEREGEAAPAAVPAAPAGERPATKEELRAWDAKVSAALQVPLTAELAEHEAVFSKYHDPDTVAYLMRQIEPLVRAGREGGRRERLRWLRAAPAKKAA